MTEVAYVGGAGRSGSTVLALLLGQLPGFFAAGGVNNLWERGLTQNLLCGCGAPFLDCPFWTSVGEAAFGGWSAIDAEELADSRRQLMRYRTAPWHLAPSLRPSFEGRLYAYAAHVEALYDAIRQVSGARVLIDSSHEVMPVLLLRRMPHVQARIIHLIRDSRAVAFSLSRRVLRAEDTSSRTYMPRYAPLPAALEWLAGNAPYHAISASSTPRIRVRYEQIVASPSTELARIAAFLGAPMAPADAARLEGGQIDLAENHMVSGNPHRLGRRKVQIRLDDEWRRSMRRRDRALVGAVTFPLNLAYGYVGVHHRGADGRRAHRKAG